MEGADVADIRIGDRIAYVAGQYGAYSTRRVLPAAQALPVPADLTHEIAAACLLKGLTADMLLTRLGRLEAGATVVVHAAAGDVGQILTQYARAHGLTVLAAVSNRDKASRVRDLSCEHIAIYGEDDLVDRVRELTDGRAPTWSLTASAQQRSTRHSPASSRSVTLRCLGRLQDPLRLWNSRS